MKRSNLNSLFAIIIFSLFAIQCKKEKIDHQFDAIQESIRGKWKLEYGKGGICGSCIQSFSNSYYTFSSNRILIVTNGTIYADTSISWKRDAAINSGGNLVYIISFSDNRGYPYIYVVDGVVSDSLVLHENASDPMYYHFSKSH